MPGARPLVFVGGFYPRHPQWRSAPSHPHSVIDILAALAGATDIPSAAGASCSCNQVTQFNAIFIFVCLGSKRSKKCASNFERVPTLDEVQRVNVMLIEFPNKDLADKKLKHKEL